mgnify:CR=1 FL=1
MQNYTRRCLLATCRMSAVPMTVLQSVPSSFTQNRSTCDLRYKNTAIHLAQPATVPTRKGT